VKNAPQCADNLESLLKKIPKGQTPDMPETREPVEMLVYCFLLWEANASKAATAYKSIINNIVDFNDLRMHLPHEIVELIGVRYPLAEQRAERLRATLRDIFLREHDVNLDSLKHMSKRDARKYLESLDGITPYVAARVLLLSLGGHAVPVDEQLRQALIKTGAADESAGIEELTSWLERQIKASHAAETHYALQTWTERKGRSRQTTTRAAESTQKKQSTSKKA